MFRNHHIRKSEGYHAPITANTSNGSITSTCGSKSASACRSAPSFGALDPVNDPAYNMKEVIKNTLLIEQHLSEKQKYCKACIIKHFLLSIGLLEEALWMAGSSVRDYPRLESSISFYNGVFEKWNANMDDDEVRLETLGQLRDWRRDMLELYYMKSTKSAI